jgi:hypothetical protein
MKTEEQIRVMKEYAYMMLERNDWHGLWDAAIDLARLQDKLEYNIKEPSAVHPGCTGTTCFCNMPSGDDWNDPAKKKLCRICKTPIYALAGHEEYCSISCVRKGEK